MYMYCDVERIQVRNRISVNVGDKPEYQWNTSIMIDAGVFIYQEFTMDTRLYPPLFRYKKTTLVVADRCRNQKHK